MSLRIVVREDDATMMVHAGSAVHTRVKTFDVDIPTLEAYLREPVETHMQYVERVVVGVEVLP